ncbi:porin family protein [Hymenobacter sp. BT730]|uniref:porin family protein n=1 Tax=Hymenobacter sp. BT730 TaxID=3063332 RepID=UPI0026DEE05A|nr:porin family protein [Hymenobacter sp. BT730]
MKSTFYLTIPALLLSQIAAAQHLRFGVKAGVNYSKDRIKNTVGPDRLLGINGGLVSRYSLTDDGFWSIQSELLYSAKGAKDKYGSTTTGARTTNYYHRNYLDLPVLAKINAKGLTFEAGPQLSYLLSFKNDVNNDLYEQPQRRDFNSLQLGYVAGIGYELPSGPNITLRYCGDITHPLQYSPTRNSVFQAQLGYMFSAKQ